MISRTNFADASGKKTTIVNTITKWSSLLASMALCSSCGQHCAQHSPVPEDPEDNNGKFENIIAKARRGYAEGWTSNDFDGDGIEEWYAYSSGSKQYETIDFNNNGKPEIRYLYAYLSRSLVIDSNEDGEGEYVENIILDPALQASGAAVTANVWTDSSGDQVVDRLTQFVWDGTSDQMNVFKMSDPDQDALFALTSASETSVYQFDQTDDVIADIEFSQCDSASEERLRVAVRKVIETGGSCLSISNGNLGYRFLRLMAMSNIKLTCKPLGTVTDPLGGGQKKICGRADEFSWICPFQLFGWCDIYIDIDSSEYCQTDDVIFHELLHFVLPAHEGSGSNDPQDRIYACGRHCFDGPNQADCDACTAGERKGCERLPPRLPSQGCYVCHCVNSTWNPAGTWFEESSACWDACAKLPIQCIGSYKDCAENYCE